MNKITRFNLELKDIPGQLVEVLEPFSKYGANIESVVHHREKKTPRGKVPVEIKVRVEEDRLKKITKSLKEKEVEIVEIDEKTEITSFNIILIGHVLHTGIKDTINRIDQTGYAEVVDLSLSMPEIKEKSSAMLRLELEAPEKKNKVLDILNEISEEKDLEVIKEISV
ncbi:MAG: ACT-domain-containing protein putative allosteric regulator of homoserine dehydrogenase [Candidatus Methanohalarchaeum thermophilum]|uniref:ACT-domain-containing protein putative allosteric regulator of homoserine dehydrogenase n=1 Tax=Methanohalarchaeum thermophilum TaxID=1903181 RepID=A0A1Q6DUB4_METT1|nr:MAG: ACT-domain-containing protein putative allosteric regulator of homoserine dehydrogenase [Candidatus Methanohalarchaeum thermophilum]